MRFLWTTAVKEWRRQARNPAELGLWLGIPLIVGALVIMASGGRGGPEPQIHVLVADNDKSLLSGFLVGAMSQDQLGGLIRAEEVNEAEGRKRIGRGDASALLIIPDSFATAALEEKPTTLTLITNPAQRIMPGIVEEMLSAFADVGFYLQRVLGDDLKIIAGGPPAGANTMTDLFVSNFSVRVNHLAESITDYLDPPAIKLVTESSEDREAAAVAEGEKEADPPGGFGFYFMPGILFMSLMFMAMGFSSDLWVEREQHTLRRLVVTPRSEFTFLVGKLLSGGVIIVAMSLFGLSVGLAYFGMSFSLLPLAVLWATLSGLMLLALMSLLQLIAPSQRGAGIIVSSVVFPLIMMGGSFFPFEAMPAWMAGIGRLTPNGWALSILKDILLGQVEPARLLTGFVVVIATTLVLTAVSGWRLRGGFAQA